jgi:hypothetical protein
LETTFPKSKSKIKLFLAISNACAKAI